MPEGVSVLYSLKRKTIMMMENRILGLLLLFCVSGCHVTKKEDSLNNFFPTGQGMTLEETILADTLFHGSCPIINDGNEYVYLVNTACSYCIAKALDCYQVFLTNDMTVPFLFLSRSEDHDIFDYYFKERYSGSPSIFSLQEDVDCGDGVFLIQNGRVAASVEWR